MLDTHTVDTFIDFYLSLKVRGRLVIIGYISKYGTDTSSQVMPFLASLPQKVGITIDIDTFNTSFTHRKVNVYSCLRCIVCRSKCTMTISFFSRLYMFRVN